jgi:hypothetical protein
VRIASLTGAATAFAEENGTHAEGVALCQGRLPLSSALGMAIGVAPASRNIWPSNQPNVGNEITLAVKKLPVNIRQIDTSTRFNTRRPIIGHRKGRKATESLTECYGTVIALIGLSGELAYPRRAW